jgi:hypothetical protein
MVLPSNIRCPTSTRIIAAERIVDDLSHRKNCISCSHCAKKLMLDEREMRMRSTLIARSALVWRLPHRKTTSALEGATLCDCGLRTQSFPAYLSGIICIPSDLIHHAQQSQSASPAFDTVALPVHSELEPATSCLPIVDQRLGKTAVWRSIVVHKQSLLSSPGLFSSPLRSAVPSAGSLPSIDLLSLS